MPIESPDPARQCRHCSRPANHRVVHYDRQADDDLWWTLAARLCHGHAALKVDLYEHDPGFVDQVFVMVSDEAWRRYNASL